MLRRTESQCDFATKNALNGVNTHEQFQDEKLFFLKTYSNHVHLVCISLKFFKSTFKAAGFILDVRVASRLTDVDSDAARDASSVKQADKGVLFAHETAVCVPSTHACPHLIRTATKG